VQRRRIEVDIPRNMHRVFATRFVPFSFVKLEILRA
jgi:hypothetical protein